MSSAESIKLLSVKQYLELEEASDTRHEYVRGQVFAMTGATLAHNLICENLGLPLQKVLESKPCRLFHHNTKVWIRQAESFYYPDIVITCERFSPKDLFISDPLLVAEISSPSTKQTDRREKLTAYMQLTGLQYCLLVHHNRILIELYQRVSPAEWQLTTLNASDYLVLSLAQNEVRIPVSSIYEGLDMPSLVKESEEEYEFG